jgi:hypothetical protein
LSRNHPRKLLVEGETDKRVIPYVMEAHGVTWPSEPAEYPVFIEAYGSVDEILKAGVVEGEIRASGLEALGVVVDADGDAAARWEDLRTWCANEFTELPKKIPAAGLVVAHSGGPRFGIWIMPDNRLTGMLEDWLVQLIPEASEPLYELARNCVADSKCRGAPFREVHRTKAEIHTWLAWQDEPGLRLYDAVTQRVLDPKGPESGPFVSWFRSLFRV